MANITLSIDEATLEAAREYARAQGWSLNEWVRRLLQMNLAPNSIDKIDAVFARADELGLQSEQPWKRQDLYDRAVLR